MIPDRYTVGRDGRVWIERGQFFGLCFVGYNSSGYPRIQVNHKGRRKWYLVHHLVMFYHGPPKPPGAWEIGHRDGDRTNPALSNLHWTTRAQNNAQSWSDGKRETQRSIFKDMALRGTLFQRRQKSA